MLSSADYKHANEIYKNNSGNSLWLGDFSAADDAQWIKQNHIKTVITTASGLNVVYDSSICHHRYTLEDKKSQNILPYFDEVGGKIQRGLKIGSVLVHCGAGVSRSASFVIAYLMKYHKKTFHEALKLTKEKRSVICPNLGFELQLKKYQPRQSMKIYEPDVTEGFPKRNNKFFSSLYSVKKNPKNQSFPQILKPRNIDFPAEDRIIQPKGHREEKAKEKKVLTRSLIHKNADNDGTRLKNELKKIAEFRFGMTNTSKWGFH